MNDKPENLQDANNFENLPDSEGFSSPQEPARLSLIQRFVGVFTSPLETFEDIAKRPDWVFPLLFAVIATMLITQLLVPVILADTQSSPSYQKLMERDDLTADQLEQMQALQTKSVTYFSALGAGLMILLMSLLVAAVLLFVGNILFGGKATYKTMFSIYCWSGLVGVLGYLVRFPLALSRGTMKIFLGPAVLFPPEAQDSTLFNLAASFDIFVIWRIILLAVGFTAVYRFSLAKSGAILGGMFVVQVIASLLFQGAI
jgi:hypothetical protein